MRFFPKRSRRRRGQIVLLSALTLPAAAAFLGLALDTGLVLETRRRVQSAADSAVMSATHELQRGKPDLAVDAAFLDAARNGFDDEAPQTSVTVNHPPAGGPRAGNTDFVEVIISENLPTYFLRFINRSQVEVRGRAVAGLTPFGETCVMTLDREASAAMRLNGTPTLLANCGVMVNSNDPEALQVLGAPATLDATFVGVTGGFSGSGTISPDPVTGVPPMVDPLAHLEPLDPAAFPPGFKSGNTYHPGVYNNRITVAGPPFITTTFEPGIYILRDGMRINNGTIVGDGVTFYHTGEGGAIDIAGNANVTLTAPPSGPMQGILFFSDPNAPNMDNRIGRGNSTFQFEGTLYFPTMHLDWAGTPLGDGSNGMIIANTLDVSGTADVLMTMPDPNQGGVEVLSATLVE